MVVNIIFGVIILINTVWLILLTTSLQNVSKNFYAYFPFLEPSGYYIDIDDVGYIPYDGVIIDEEKMSNGEEVKVYTQEEINEILRSAS